MCKYVVRYSVQSHVKYDFKFFSFFTDTRYFKGMMDTPLSLDSKTSLPTDRLTWMKLEEVSKSLTAWTKHMEGTA